MKICYLVTLYNKAAYLPHLLAGLAAQRGGFERSYVFVDDGSTDQTLPRLSDLTREWPDTRIIAQTNAGPARALNAGLGLVAADFVKPVDGDDQLYPWATSALLTACNRFGTLYAYAPMDLQQRYQLDDEPASPREPMIEPVRDDGFLRRALRRAVTNPTLWIARTDLLQRLGGCDEGVFVQDYSAELRLAVSGPAARVDAAIMAMPAQAPGRLSANDAQTLHDVNLALLRFLRGQPGLSAGLRRFALRRAVGRARKWAHRHGGGSQPALLLAAILARAGWLQPTPRLEALVCAPFRQSGQVRLCTDR